jgi:peroxiredoxin
MSPIEEAFRAAAPAGARLAEHLAKVAAEARERAPEYMRSVDSFVARLERVRAGASAPAPGDMLPGFTLPDQDGRLVTLGNLLERGPAVVAILRGHWCPYCRLNMIGLAQLHEAHPDLSIAVISPEVQQFTRTLRQQSGAQFPVLTDLGAGYILSRGLAVLLDEPLARMIADAGWDVPLFQGGTGWVLPIPSVFVVRQDGTVAARHVDPDFRRRMELDDLMAAVAAANHVA